MTKSKKTEIIILKFVPLFVYFCAQILDQYIMGGSIPEAIFSGLIAGIFMGLLYEGWGIFALELYLLFYPQKRKFLWGIVVIFICFINMLVNYHVSEFIFSFAGTWNLGKLCVLYLNVAYAVVTLILMLIPAGKLLKGKSLWEMIFINTAGSQKPEPFRQTPHMQRRLWADCP